MPHTKWTAERVLIAVRSRAASGQSMIASTVRLRDSPLYHAAKSYFGSWCKAVEASGLEYQRAQRSQYRSWTPDKVVEEIRRRRANGYSVSAWDVQRSANTLFMAAYNHFGDWNAALRAANVAPSTVQHIQHELWDRERVKRGLIALNAEGASLAPSDLVERHRSLYQAAIRYYGSLAAAVECAGLPVTWTLRQRKPRT